MVCYLISWVRRPVVERKHQVGTNILSKTGETEMPEPQTFHLRRKMRSQDN